MIQPENGRDVFEIESIKGKVIIRGNSGVSMAMGLNWYLKYSCKCNVSWCGDNLALPKKLRIEMDKRRVALTKDRVWTTKEGKQIKVPKVEVQDRMVELVNEYLQEAEKLSADGTLG